MKSNLKILLLFVACSCVWSCDLFAPQENEGVVASYKSQKLTKQNVARAMPDGLSAQDSLAWLDTYLDKWLLEAALLENAQQNIDQNAQENIEDLVAKYRQELYTQQYTRLMVQQKMDTVVTPTAIEKYYEGRSENFKLNEELIRMQYIHLDERNPDRDELEKLFKKNDSISISKLKEARLGFKGFNLNDSIWLKKSTIFEDIPPVNLSNQQRYLATGKVQEIVDSTGVYYLRTLDRLERGDQAPLSYVTPTIRQILLSKKKLQYVNKLKTDLLNDARSSNEVIRYDK